MGAPAPETSGAFAFPKKAWCHMANVDFVGDATGGLTHYWPGRLSDRIEAETDIPLARSGKQLQFSQELLDSLSPEIRAALIAHDVYDGYYPEFWTEAEHIAGINSREIAGRFKWNERNGQGLGNSEKWLIGYTGTQEGVVSYLQELAWLRQAIGAGVTPGDLLEWGVNRFTVVQLLWWERRPGETRLSRHIRAIRNGWGLRYLEQSVRDTYRNLLQFIDKGAAPDAFLDRFEADLADVRELQAFFAEEAATLSDARQAEWAKAFLDAGIIKVAPDAWGQFAHFLPASFKQGILRKPLEPIARYLEGIGVGPSDWADFDEGFFGRS